VISTLCPYDSDLELHKLLATIVFIAPITYAAQDRCHKGKG
jgi:hypothetical protein